MNRQEFLLVGIAAPTCSGKTTLLRELKRRLDGKIAILSFDEYDLYPSGSPALSELLKISGKVSWEDPSLFDSQRYFEDLQKLRNGKPVILWSRSRESQAEGIQTRTIKPKQFTVIEGIHVFSDPRAEELFDRRYYIDIPAEEMVRRRLERTPKDSTDPWDNPSYIKVDMVAGTEYYVRPQRAKAHVVLDGLLPTTKLAEQVISDLKR